MLHEYMRRRICMHIPHQVLIDRKVRLTCSTGGEMSSVPLSVSRLFVNVLCGWKHAWHSDEHDEKLPSGLNT